MKTYRIIAGASAAVLAMGLMTACSSKQEPVVEEEPIVQEEIQQEVTPEVTPEEDVIVEFPLEEETAEEAEEEQSAEAMTVQVAEITEIADDGTMTILPYALADESAELMIEDYANVDFSAFVAGEEAEALELSEDVLFQTVIDGELTDADESALMVGSMLIITTADDGSRSIVIYNPVAE